MFRLSKVDNFVIENDSGSGLFEVVLTTTYKKETNKGKVEKTHSVKTYDTDIDRAYSVLSRAMVSYFSSIKNIFEVGENVQDKSDEARTA